MEENAPQEVATEPTLDDIISEYNVQEVPQVQQQPAPIPEPQPVTREPLPKVDPLDEDSFKSFHESVQSGQSVLSQQLDEVKSELTQMQQERAELKVEADINKAVETVNDGLNLDPQVVRVFLELTAQQKPGFKKIWDSRDSNPTAYKKALGAFKKEIGAKFNNLQDPELTQTQRAIQQSQQSMASRSGTEPSDEDPIAAELGAATSDSEWSRIWAKYTNGG